jgi:sec-independent protein translocase protein TatA
MTEMPTDLMYLSWSLPQLLLVLLIVVLLFGRGKISELMGDFAKGIRSFKKGLSDDDATASADAAAAQKKALEHDAAAPRPEMRTGAGTETKA